MTSTQGLCKQCWQHCLCVGSALHCMIADHRVCVPWDLMDFSRLDFLIHGRQGSAVISMERAMSGPTHALPLILKAYVRHA